MKDPAFLFYSSDFLTGTMFMTNEQVGQYIRLLCAQHQKGRLTEKHMLNICKAYDEEVYSKFTKDDNGLYYNPRLEDESIKRANFAESRRNNAKGKRKITKKPLKAYAKHMEDENENENINKSKDKKEKEKIVFPFTSKKFMESWDRWLTYKREEHNFKYKSNTSIQAALMDLNKKSNNNESVALEIIMQSISNGWKGFFTITKNNNNNESDKKSRRAEINRAVLENFS